MNTHRAKKLLARIIVNCFRYTPRSLIMVGDITFIGIDFDKAPTTLWSWFTYAFSAGCAFVTIVWALAYVAQLLCRLYQWADENE